MDDEVQLLRVPTHEWVQRFENEYLSDYLKSGGSAVKVLSGSASSHTRAIEAICSASSRNGYFFVKLDPNDLDDNDRKPDLHRIDRFFFETTGGVDWKAWAATEAKSFLQSHGILITDGRELNDIEGIATDNGRVSTDLINQYQREFATPLIRDHRLSIEFRAALKALSSAQLDPESMSATTEEVLISWFAGKSLPGAAAALKRIQIFARIDRSNARYILSSFCRWLSRTGRAGLVVVLDFRPYENVRMTVAQRRKVTEAKLKDAIASRVSHAELDRIVAEGDELPPTSYSQTAYLQMLQLLRRFIDDIDLFEGFCLIVLTSQKFCQTERSSHKERHYTDYDALQTRIGLEVHDIRRANPVASLVHLGDAI